jgi:hypothetical protein
MNIFFAKTPHQDYVQRLKEGVTRTGDKSYDLTHSTIPDEADVIAVWGVANAKRWQEKGYKNVLILERGYLGDRIEWLSLGWDNLNGKANFYNTYVPEDRWDKHWKSSIRDWRDSGDVVLIAGQVLRDQSLSDCVNYNEWLSNTIQTLKSKGHRVIFRPHPLETGYSVNDVAISKYKDFVEDILRAKCLVTWSSTSSVSAAYYGVPSVVFSDFSMTKEISSNSLDTLDFKPDRNNWGRKIAYCQWNPVELTTGEAWYHLKTRFYY